MSGRSWKSTPRPSDGLSRLERARLYCHLIEGGMAVADVLEGMDDAIVITGLRRGARPEAIVRVNTAFERLSGYARSTLIGGSPRLLQGGRTRRDELDRLKLCLADQGWFEGEIVNYRRSVDEYVMGWAVTGIRGADGQVCNWLSVQNDITRDLLSFRRPAHLRSD